VRTLEEIYTQGKNQLSLSCFPHPDRDAKILLCESVSISLERFFSTPRKKVTKIQADQFFHLIKMRQKGFPLAYLTGKKEFWSLEFTVNSSVLIPRPETEMIIEKTVELSPKTGILVDIGTGCGCIAVSLARELPMTRFVATDISKKALETACLNAKIFKLDRIEFYQGSMFVPLKKLKLEDKCDVIVSNPPYVSEEEWKELSVQITHHEPKRALVSGQTGLENIEELIHQSPLYLKPGGFLIFEFGAGQKENILNKFGHEWRDVRSYNDLYGIPRIMVARKK